MVENAGRRCIKMGVLKFSRFVYFQFVFSVLQKITFIFFSFSNVLFWLRYSFASSVFSIVIVSNVYVSLSAVGYI